MRHQHDVHISPHSPPLPTGENIADYDGSKTWSNRQWAWEFLRRNKEFQLRCEQIDRDDIPRKERNVIVRQGVGLLEYKSFLEPFKAHGMKPTRFITADIGKWSRVSKTQQKKLSRTPHIIVRPGDVLVRFNVRAIEKSRKAINAQLRDAGALLEKRSEQWLKRKKSPVGKMTRLKSDLLRALRLLDLTASNDLLPKGKRLSRSQLFVKIKGADVEKKRIEDVGATEYQESFQQLKEIAERYAYDQYLDLAAS